MIATPCEITTRAAGQKHTPTSAQGEFVFVNNIRYWSMFAVILLHSLLFRVGETKDLPFDMELLAQAAKFGTFGFFLSSGFLLGTRLDQQHRWSYFRRRLHRIGTPWLLWVAAYCFVRVFGPALHHGVLPTAQEASAVTYTALFVTAYWFIPNMMIALGIILLFARHIDDWRFGALAFGATLFYSVNIYAGWLPTAHTMAAFGYVAYLWLGAWAARHWRRVSKFISDCPVPVLSFLTVASYLVALSEASVLRSLGHSDPLNTLRLSNQIFSLAIVLLLLKISRPTWPNFLNVRDHTYGLYLTHTVVQVPIAWLLLAQAHGEQSESGVFSAGLLMFAMTYLGAVLITRWLASQERLGWLVGAQKGNQRLQRGNAALGSHEVQCKCNEQQTIHS